ncbi:hypothetical protein C8T65DRAFT_561417, partial [Cerioporus squamosus]
YGMVLGAPAIDLEMMMGEKKPVLNRFYRIVVPIAAHFIWKVRCERVIRCENDLTKAPSNKEVAVRWAAEVRKRAAMDWYDSSGKLRRKPVDRDLVRDTWEGVV